MEAVPSPCQGIQIAGGGQQDGGQHDGGQQYPHPSWLSIEGLKGDCMSPPDVHPHLVYIIHLMHVQVEDEHPLDLDLG